MTDRKKNLALAGVSILIILASFGAWKLIQDTAPKPGKKEREKIARLVDAEPLEKVASRASWQTGGAVTASDSVTLVAQVSGRVEQVSAQAVPGALLKKGALLAQLEKGDYELALEQAQATLAQAKAALAIEEGQVSLAQEGDAGEWCFRVGFFGLLRRNKVVLHPSGLELLLAPLPFHRVVHRPRVRDAATPCEGAGSIGGVILKATGARLAIVPRVGGRLPAVGTLLLLANHTTTVVALLLAVQDAVAHDALPLSPLIERVHLRYGVLRVRDQGGLVPGRTADHRRRWIDLRTHVRRKLHLVRVTAARRHHCDHQQGYGTTPEPDLLCCHHHAPCLVS